MTRPAAWLLALAVMPAAAGFTRAQEPAPQAIRAFTGSWSASGQRLTLPTEGSRPAAVVRASGALYVSSVGGSSIGFTAEAIAFDDGSNETTGRAVWTDSSGERIYSTIRGGPLANGRKITGKITNGTGRWAGVLGDYELTWQYVVAGDTEQFQGRSTDLHGSFKWRESKR